MYQRFWKGQKPELSRVGRSLALAVQGLEAEQNVQGENAEEERS